MNANLIAPLNVRLGSKLLLSQFRRPWAATVQMAALVCLLLQPLMHAHAIYVPDENGGLDWVDLPDENWQSSSSYSDNDGDGFVDWQDNFYQAVADGTVTYWSGGTFVIDGVSVTLGGQWHANSSEFFDTDGDGIPDEYDLYPNDYRNNTLTDIPSATPTDSDGDGIPDDLDSYPWDATNNSFEWQGGTFTINGIRHVFRSGIYEGSPNDSNFNEVPDCLEDWFTNPSAHGNIQFWAGGTFLISGSWCTFDPINYYADSVVDSDSDGIPDEIDAWPWQVWNNTWFDWQGGDFYLYGSLTHFNAQTYGGVWSDIDGDAIPDVADPLPEDADNGNTPITTTPVYFWPEPGSTAIATVNNQSMEFPATEYTGYYTDSDGDGIPDPADPFPWDAGNGNSAEITDPSYAWPESGTELTHLISGQYVLFSSQEYPGIYSDIDADGIPDPADPFPSDVNNGNSDPGPTFLWPDQGTTHSCLVNNTAVEFSSTEYSGEYADSDSDGIPDQADPYPADAGNGNTDTDSTTGSIFTWPALGATISAVINNQDWTFSSSEYSGVSNDADLDGIPDQADPYPNDAGNGNTPTNISPTFVWPESACPFMVDYQWFWCEPTEYTGVFVDDDADGILDFVDPYPGDAVNGSPFFNWPAINAETYVINNQAQEFVPTQYMGTYSDQDQDGIPDVVDPYPNSAINGNEPGQTSGTSNPNQPIVSGQDSDGDWMTDEYELANGLDPSNPTDGMQSAAGDWVFNFEKAAHNLPAAVAIWDAATFESVTGRSFAAVQAAHDESLSLAESDWDGDGVSNVDETTLFGTSFMDPSSVPSHESILRLIQVNAVSATTLMNYNWLLANVGGGDGSSGGGDTSGGAGGDTSGGGDSGGTSGGDSGGTSGGDSGGTSGGGGTGTQDDNSGGGGETCSI